MSRSRHQATHGGGTRLGSDGTVFIHLGASETGLFYLLVSQFPRRHFYSEFVRSLCIYCTTRL